jgi:hypothetical protein
MQRTLQPELLDSLPHDHPDALHNRRDLRLINRVMGNHRWFERTLPPLLRVDDRVLEVGAGTGELGLRLARHRVPVAGLDLWPRPDAWPGEQLWHRGDLRHFDGYSKYTVILGNLIFHQFPAAELLQLGSSLEGARVILACEPHRHRSWQLLYRAFTFLLGANHVSRHDGHVSIAAGFCREELPESLGLNPERWNIRCTSTLFGAYRMTAVRIR